MKKMLFFLLTIVILITSLCGCDTINKKDEFTFRDIPFGTEFSNVKKQMDKDLKEQGYERQADVYEDEMNPSLEYLDFDLYNYKVNAALDFYKNNNDKLDDAEFVSGTYYYRDKSDGKEFFGFCKEKLIEKYGEDYTTKFDGNTIIWDKNDTMCTLSLFSNDVTLDYSSKKLIDKWAKIMESEKNESDSSKNRGF